MKTIEFLTEVGKKCSPIRQEFILLSDTLGVSALVDAINNPPINGATESSVLGPFFTEDAPDGMSSPSQTIHNTTDSGSVELGDSIASEGKGEYLYVEGRVLSTDGKPVPDATIETWETDGQGLSSEYKTRSHR